MIEPARNIFETPLMSIAICRQALPEHARVLDIGGGGEGIISRLYTHHVVAIDIRREELDEVEEDGALKIVMDATALQFTDAQFDRATAFFSFMYMSQADISRVIREVHRVLKKGGVFEIWDVNMPAKSEVDYDIFVAQLEISLDELVIPVGYGVSLPEMRQNKARIETEIAHAGFMLETARDERGWFYVAARK